MFERVVVSPLTMQREYTYRYDGPSFDRLVDSTFRLYRESHWPLTLSTYHSCVTRHTVARRCTECVAEAHNL